MKPGWIIGLVMLFIILQVVASICELQYLGAGETSKLQTLLSPDFPTFKNPLTALVAYIQIAWDFVKTLWSMFWFDYPFWYDAAGNPNSWMIARYIFFIPVSIGVVVSLVLAAIRGVSS